MSGVIYSLSCPIGAIGGECFWTITCLDGTKQTIVLLEGEISAPCIDITAASGGIRYRFKILKGKILRRGRERIGIRIGYTRWADVKSS